MNGLNLEQLGLQELTNCEMAVTDGGFLEFLYEYFTGNSLASDARALTKAAINASVQVIQEGGTHCTHMPFK